MPSVALSTWTTARSAMLDEIESAHRSVGGHGPGRRHATQQINYAYAVLLSAQFQAFCRDLYSECVNAFVQVVGRPSLRTALRKEFLLHCRLDRGNPNPGSIGADFNRFGFTLWDDVLTADTRSSARRAQLEELNAWRNAIAHYDFDPNVFGAARLR